MKYKNNKTNTFCISLPRATDRREHFSKQCEQRNIQYSFFQGVDGNKITDMEGNSFERRELTHATVLIHNNDLLFKYIPHTLDVINNKKMNVYQICSAKSNLMIYEQLVKDKTNDVYLIFEDDFIMNENFTLENMDTIVKDLPDDFDACFFSLMHAHKIKLPKEKQITNNIYKVGSCNWFSGTSCYLFSKKAAKKFMNLNGTNLIFAGDDIFSYFSFVNDINIYCSELVLGFGHDTQKFPSTIDTIRDLNNA
jgi:GR25 family glycosyltransferase involved in LPS biosynthesis